MTAGDLVFEAIGRDLHVVDAKTGKKLAQVDIKISAASTPMTYQAGGKQFVAIVSGSNIVALGLP